jgi:hypothetical protein
MTDEERKDLRERLQRYEKLRREQLGTSITLIQGLAAAGVAFCVSHIADEKVRFTDKTGSVLFVVACSLFVLTVGLCMLTTFTRLRDFRGTAKKLRAELDGVAASELKLLADKNRKLGRRTWLLFRVQSVAFLLGVLILALSVWLLQQSHLFPTQRSAETEKTGHSTDHDGTAKAAYMITGSYSVDEATHVKQMADCKASEERFLEEIRSNKRKPGDNLIFDSYDAAFLHGHICASWAAEPLDEPSRKVIEIVTSLDSLMMAHERVRYEDVKAQLDYYHKKNR